MQTRGHHESLGRVGRRLAHSDDASLDEELLTMSPRQKRLERTPGPIATSAPRSALRRVVEAGQKLRDIINQDGAQLADDVMRNMLGVDPSVFGTEKVDEFTNGMARSDRCCHCHDICAHVRFCERCKVVTYCSRACAKADWNSVHKHVCRQPGKYQVGDVVFDSERGMAPVRVLQVQSGAGELQVVCDDASVPEPYAVHVKDVVYDAMCMRLNAERLGVVQSRGV